MLTRPFKLLIGKDVSRDAHVVAGASMTTIMLSTGMADGEIVVLDKNKKVLAEGATYSDSDTIYIAQGTGETFSITSETGTTTTGNRKLVISDPIEGHNVKTFIGRAYSAKSEQVSTVDLTGWTPAVGTEYIVRIVYHDLEEHPGQFVHSYRHIGTTAVLATEAALIVAAINKHKGRRVLAAYNAGTEAISLTGLAIPECTTSLNDIDEFKQVNFDVFFNYVDSDGYWQTIPSTVTTVSTTAASSGVGTWEQVRDMEKVAMGYKGITSLTHFPVIKPDFKTVKNATYNLIIIEHDKTYRSPDNQYAKKTPLTTVIAIPVPVAGTQTASVLAQLNPWMATTPGAFGNVVL